MEEAKNKYKIWNWTIEKQNVPMSLNPTGKPSYWYAICGVSDQYQGGCLICSSEIKCIDFETGIVETQNSIYELQKEFRDFTVVTRHNDIKELTDFSRQVRS